MSDHIQITTRIEADTTIVVQGAPGSEHQWLEIGRQINLFADTEQLVRLRDAIDAHLAGRPS